MNIAQKVHHPLVPAIMGYASETNIEKEIFSEILPGDLQPADSARIGLTLNQLQQLEQNISELTGDPSPGLRIGESLHWANVGIVGYIVVNSRNVLEGLKKFQAYYRMVSNITTFNLITRGHQIELCWQPIDRKLIKHHRVILEGILACLTPLLQEQTGKTIRPKEIQFCWPAPTDLSEYNRVFDSRLSFNGTCIKAVFDRSVGELSCVQPNAEILQVLENHVRDRCFRERAENPHSGEVLKILRKNNGDILGVEQVAEKLGTSVRNLQIRLKKEGATFRTLRDQSLCEQARLFLANSPVSIEKISNQLGFSEPAVFYRNFKRWTGQTPNEYRTSATS